MKKYSCKMFLEMEIIVEAENEEQAEKTATQYFEKYISEHQIGSLDWYYDDVKEVENGRNYNNGYGSNIYNMSMDYNTNRQERNT